MELGYWQEILVEDIRADDKLIELENGEGKSVSKYPDGNRISGARFAIPHRERNYITYLSSFSNVAYIPLQY